MTAIESHAVIPGWNDNGEALPERLDQELLARAYQFSERAHVGQKRLSGRAAFSIRRLFIRAKYFVKQSPRMPQRSFSFTTIPAAIPHHRLTTA